MSFSDFLQTLNFKPKIVQVWPNTNEKLSEVELFNKKLDAMIVLPALREGLGALDSLYAAARQVKENKLDFVHGITLVLNKRTDSGERDAENKASNLLTLKLLYYIRYGEYIFKKDELTLEQRKMVSRIRESGVPIYLIDASTDGYNTQDMTVGMARRLGDEFSYEMLKPGGRYLLFGSDSGDTMLGPKTLQAIKDKVDSGSVDAGPLRWITNLHGLTLEERRAHFTSALFNDTKRIYLKLEKVLDDFTVESDNVEDGKISLSVIWEPTNKVEPKIRKRLIDMPGGGSFYTVEALKNSGGHNMTQGYHEDTDLIFGMLEKGSVVRDLEKIVPEAYFLTKARISDRPEDGFGKGISKFNPKKGRIEDVKVPSSKSISLEESILQEVSNLNYDTTGSINKKAKKLYLFFKRETDLSDKDIKILVGLFIKMNGKDNNFGHHRLIKEIRQISDSQFEFESLEVLVNRTKRKAETLYKTLSQSGMHRYSNDEEVAEELLLFSPESVSEFINQATNNFLLELVDQVPDLKIYCKIVENDMFYQLINFFDGPFDVFFKYKTYSQDLENDNIEKKDMDNLFAKATDLFNLEIQNFFYQIISSFLKDILRNLGYKLTEKQKVKIRELIKAVNVIHGELEKQEKNMLKDLEMDVKFIYASYPNFFKVNGIVAFLGVRLTS